jgi:hypothetical protein
MTEPRMSFGRRQVAGEPTVPQIVFDVLFGLLLPVPCLVLDPLVFRADGAIRGGVLSAWALPAYLFIGMQILMLGAWLLVGGRTARGAAWFAGPLAAGGIVAGLVGIAILPFTAIGLLFLIGALGFIPFLTSFVYLRNALRARARGRAYAGASTTLALMLAGLVCAVLPAVAAHLHVKRSFEALLRDPDRPIGWAERLAVVEADRIVWEYQSARPGARRDALARLYRRLTGVDVEDRLAILND